MRYIKERVIKERGMGKALIHFDQFKVFGRVHNRYLQVILVAADFGPVFRGCNTALYKGVRSVV